jgi:hypothetical protein
MLRNLPEYNICQLKCASVRKSARLLPPSGSGAASAARETGIHAWWNLCGAEAIFRFVNGLCHLWPNCILGVREFSSRIITSYKSRIHEDHKSRALFIVNVISLWPPQNFTIIEENIVVFLKNSHCLWWCRRRRKLRHLFIFFIFYSFYKICRLNLALLSTVAFGLTRIHNIHSIMLLKDNIVRLISWEVCKMANYFPF